MKLIRRFLCALLALALLGALGAWGIWYAFQQNAAFFVPEQEKTELFAGKNVMVFAPHEDDELNLFGGLFEEYIACGSRVTVVFLTNGDMYVPRETRLSEAISALAAVGVAEENIVFLGYGDGYNNYHLYNADGGERMISLAGYMETHGLPSHPAYVEEHEYTKRNMIDDIKSVIRDNLPDLIFCNDCDPHVDHIACSLAFEQAMGELLAELPDYRPAVLKGYAYDGAFYNQNDFYAPNLLSTVSPAEEDAVDGGYYSWRDRIRLPVDAASLSRSLYGCSLYKAAKFHASQNAADHAVSMINGDKVFWQRNTSSLCYGAETRASSGDASCLTDFRLRDSSDVYAEKLCVRGGAWVPEEGDTEKWAEVLFPSETTISTLCLYGTCPDVGTVSACEILLSDGSRYVTGALSPAGTEISLGGEKSVTGFRVKLLRSSSPAAGLTEVEAYQSRSEEAFPFIKLQDAAGNFAYDWVLPSGCEDAVFSVYSSGGPEEAEYTLRCEGSGCSAALEGDSILVHCPKGSACILTVEEASTGRKDSARISSPGWLPRFGQQLEAEWTSFILNTWRGSQAEDYTMRFLNKIRK